ncbi:Dyp-type peroxidase [Enterobacterales bacterium AE_CKDN230030158-1A_HGKHYDSX7]
MSGAAFTAQDAQDTQALLRTAFDRLACTLLLLRVEQPATARAWLRGLAGRLARVEQIGRDKPPVQDTLQLAFTAAGLRRLGGGPWVEQFAAEFTCAADGDENRLRRLGDTGPNAPEHWQWGAAEREPHLLLMLFCAPQQLQQRTGELLAEAQAAGLAALEVLPAADLDGFEPFGFRDGLSQPELDWHGLREPGGEADMDYQPRIALGEFLLGYRNEYGLHTERPLLDPATPGATDLPLAVDRPGLRDLGRNGSYLVLRQLRQDVSGFWHWVRQNSEDQQQALELAEAMVGRHLDGEPFAGLQARPVPSGPSNDFTYAADRAGQVCPLGAHVRRANPRSGDFPRGRSGTLQRWLAQLGLSGSAEEDHIASARFHRLLRRGREYGNAPYVALDGQRATEETGLHFICLNASLGRQFEFVQSAWIASARFAGLSQEQDPLLGNRQPFPGTQPSDGFSRPEAAGPCRFSRGLPLFVQVHGGAYFFLPGLRALGWMLREP